MGTANPLRTHLDIVANLPSCIIKPRWRRPHFTPHLHARHIATKPKRAESRAIQRLNTLLEDALKIVETEKIPQEAEILNSLFICEELGNSIKGVSTSAAHEQNKDVPTPAGSLLFLDEGIDPKSGSSRNNLAVTRDVEDKAIDSLSHTAYRIITDPKVFITPKVMESYIKIQALLERPESLGEVLQLYATKPIPVPQSTPIRYVPAKPNAVASAVPVMNASAALDAAIRAQNLPLCIDIIKNTVCTKAFYRQKLLRRAGIPASGLALAPLAAYTLATQLSIFQNSMSNEMATNIAFAGILTYVGCTATIGFIALTTTNDQMERVTWATGTPLRERWLKEEERALLDRVACAWGFKESWKRGDEEGRDWEALRELVGLRGMVLDRVELMEGME